MALTVNTNIASLNAQRHLNANQTNLAKSMQRLSSGLRINSAKDDAAGLAISDRMTAQIRGLNQAVRNANDGISLAQTAEGALQETTNLLQRIRELAVQSANDTNHQSDRDSLQAEVTQNLEEITRIAENTTFNGRVLLNGGTDAEDMVFHVGADADQSITFSIAAANLAGLSFVDVDTTPSVLSQESANDAIGFVDEALKRVDSIRGGLGAIQNRFESTIANLSNVSENLAASRSRILDADIAQETSEMTKNNILQQAGVSILAQANQTPQLALSLLS
ncbi:MAG: flagellin [Desulfobulbus oligotrophicus]|jgi:flagellin|nr:flagellin [Desulfobulbus oligotrophicus]